MVDCTGTFLTTSTATEGISSDFATFVFAFRNSDNTGAHAQVKFEVHRTNIVSGATTPCSASQQWIGAGAVFTTASWLPTLTSTSVSTLLDEARSSVTEPPQFADLFDRDLRKRRHGCRARELYAQRHGRRRIPRTVAQTASQVQLGQSQLPLRFRRSRSNQDPRNCAPSSRRPWPQSSRCTY